MEKLEVAAMGTQAETPITCGLCHGVPHENHHCCLIREDQPMGQANYMGNQQRQPYHDPNANTYNLGWKNHPNLGECKAITLRSGKALEDISKKVNVHPIKENDKGKTSKEAKVQQPQKPALARKENSIPSTTITEGGKG
ncbi:hypothetical protein PIB30_088912 [Stylosanthes scabra]|uniref:Uncharacterized protein n=1 Tax=Stylosanthes scabra TaxID=79078 RepID=A0ABU6WUY6_9FABA|nr:hypothetical protein [Stylosanthes scabra]